MPPQSELLFPFFKIMITLCFVTDKDSRNDLLKHLYVLQVIYQWNGKSGETQEKGEKEL